MSFPIPCKERIAQIASWLPETPGHFGPTAADRATWEPFAHTETARDIIAKAEALIGAPIPPLPDDLYLQYTQIGDRKNYERVYFNRIREQLCTVVQAEVFEYKGRFLPTIEAHLNALFKEKSWVLPAHDAQLTNFNGTALYADLFCSEVCARIAVADWWLQDKLKPETRARLRTEVDRRMFAAYRHVIRTGEVINGQWWTVGGNNWNTVCHAQLIIAAMLLLPDRLERAEMLAGAEAGLPYFVAGFPKDGYCTEGMGYWGYGYGRFLMLAEIAWMMTGGKLSFYDNEILHKVAAYATNIQIEERCCAAFADCGVTAAPLEDALGIIQFRYPDAVLKQVPPRKEFTLDALMSILRCFTLGGEPPKDVPADGQLPDRSYFPYAGIFIARSVKDGHRFGLACKAGNNAEQHNHNDIGSFVVARDGKQFFLDPGAEIYTKRTFSAQRYDGQMLNSYGHMVPVVGGKLQSPGAACKGDIISTTFTDDVDTVVMDLKPAYPTATELVTLKRTFVFNRKDQTLAVRDEVAYTTPQSFETALVTYADLSYPGKNQVTSTVDGVSVTATATAEGADIVLTEGLIDNPKATCPKRVAVALDKPVLKASISIVFSF